MTNTIFDSDTFHNYLITAMAYTYLTLKITDFYKKKEYIGWSALTPANRIINTLCNAHYLRLWYLPLKWREWNSILSAPRRSNRVFYE